MLSIILDTGVLGQVTNPRASGARPPVRWLLQHLAAGARVCVPEIADYELRRELIRGGMNESVARLDEFRAAVEYLPITTPAMRLAARFWAEARNRGRPAASDLALDGDMILAAQARLLTEDDPNTLVATTNVRHLIDFVDARLWNEISVAF
jgi:predicted nucleic acid-binding protein